MTRRRAGHPASGQRSGPFRERDVEVSAGDRILRGVLVLPVRARGVVLLVHANGSADFPLLNSHLAAALQGEGFATLQIDLLSQDETADTTSLTHLNPIIECLMNASDWLGREPDTRNLALGYVGMGSGAAAALSAAARQSGHVSALILVGGRLDPVVNVLPGLRVPTLLIAGESDETVIEMNEMAHNLLRCEREFVVVPGSNYGMGEPGIPVEQVSRLARDWMRSHMVEIQDRAA